MVAAAAGLGYVVCLPVIRDMGWVFGDASLLPGNSIRDMGLSKVVFVGMWGREVGLMG